MTNEVHVRSERTAVPLKQRDLAHLVGRSDAAVSRWEGGIDTPDIEEMLALEVVFGKPPRVLFPSLYARIEEAVMSRAAELDERVRGRVDPMSKRIQMFLVEIVERAGRTSAA